MLLTALVLSFTPVVLAQDPAPEAPAAVPARVGETAVKVRAFHHDTMPVLAELEPGTPVEIVAKREPWARVTVPGGLTVWVFGKYVDVDGAKGVLNTDHVRARPLPSTGTESYPVGQFAKGDVVQVLDQQGDWIQVRGPEELGGWVPLAAVVEYSQKPGDWAATWKDARTARAAGPAVVADTPPAPTGQEPAAELPAEAVPPTPGELAQAEAKLAQLAHTWNPATADEVGALLGAVLWASDDVVQVDRARVGLARLETLRSAAALEAKVKAEKNRLDQEARAAEAKAEQAAEAAKPAPPPPAERFTTVGLLEFKPRVYSAVPFVVTAGGKSQPVLAKLGRYDLKEFAGREVAVLGIFRPSTVQGLRVLEIDKLRVLPKRPKK